LGRIYNNTHKIRFTQISERYDVNRTLKGNISKTHSSIIEYVVSHFKDSKKYKQQVVDILNIITYAAYADEHLPNNWKDDDPFKNIPDIDSELISDTLGDVFLTVDAIDWDVKPTIFSEDIQTTVESPVLSSSEDSSTNFIQQDSTSIGATISPKDEQILNDLNKGKIVKPVSQGDNIQGEVISPTPKQDLYIQAPNVPQFDYSRPWIRGREGADNLVIYTTLPEIPTKQNEISVTTDVSKMRYEELMHLYPNCLIRTRASVMYEPLDGVELDPDIGLILPIEGFTREQVIDNIIKYPHLFKLVREVDGQHYSFYSHIEIDGELKGTLDVWDNLPESKILPRQAEFVKEYVVRRYLLERDIKNIQHMYPIHGTLNPFLTLFMPSEGYIKRGYIDTDEIAKMCVTSRVSYKQSRNPILRRLKYA